MGFLRTDYSEVNSGFEPLPIGDYECIVSKVEVTTSQSSGAPMLKVTLTVRDDVEQEGGKRKFFDNLPQMDNMMWKFQQVSKAAQLPAGQDFETLEEFAAAIQYQPVIIRNKHEMYNGEKNDKVGFWKESKIGGGTEAGGAGDPFANNGQPIDISDDDLPF